MKILPFSEIDPSDWDALVASSPDGFLWATAAWREVVLGVERWGLVDHSFGIYDGGRLVAVTPLQYIPAIQQLASGGWSLSGPVVIAGAESKYRRKIIQYAMMHIEGLAHDLGASSISFGAPAMNETSLKAPWGVNPWLEYGFDDCSGTTRIVDLAPDEDVLWKNVSSTAKHAIRKAREEGLSVSRERWADMLDAYYAAHVETYTRTGVPPHPRAYFENIAIYSAPAGTSVLWVCRDMEGKAVAFHNSALFKEAGMYHTGCSIGTASRSGAGYLLFWEALRGVKQLGCRWYECGETFPAKRAAHAEKDKTFGLTVFKSKFGGEDHRVFKCIRHLEHNIEKRVAEPLKRELLKNFMRSGKQLVRAILGRDATERLAGWLWGGYRFVQWAKRPRRTSFIRPYWGGRELAALCTPSAYNRALDRCRAVLRRDLALETGDDVVLTSSGRTALEVCLRGLAQKYPGRRVVVIPSYSCKGVLDPVERAGLIPLYVDSTSALNPDQGVVREVLDETVLACVYPHLCGNVDEVSQLRGLAQEHGIAWIDDYCQGYAPGLDIAHNGFAVFSFGMGKNLMATAGGALVARGVKNNNDISHVLSTETSKHAGVRLLVILLRHFLRFSVPDRFLGKPRALGAQYEYKGMSKLDAVLLNVQLAKAPEIIRVRRENGQNLLEVMPSDVPGGITAPRHLFTKFPLVCKDDTEVERLCAVFWKYNIELENMYIPLHMRFDRFCVSEYCPPCCEKLKGHVFNVPVRPNMSNREKIRVRRALSEFFGERDNG
ncbi:conserved hypothetical protein [uncultured delta proteobacterium]|uniref:BioF2-like acetyltransferase domain-containing protein n=1 Tax=uncultured delta proteobacterium TaxID=34034 RepID=A0A212KGT6_9DELT|nr:conserved hypothetical protein [uncultured delta proteobacterium]